MVDRLPGNDGPRPDTEVTQEVPRPAVPDQAPPGQPRPPAEPQPAPGVAGPRPTPWPGSPPWPHLAPGSDPLSGAHPTPGPHRRPGRAQRVLAALGRGTTWAGRALRQGTTRASRALRPWARGPAGRLAIPGLALVAVLAASTAGGRWLVPEVAPPLPTAPGAPSPADAPTAAPPITEPSGSPFPYPSTPTSQPPAGTRPVDALAGWAGQISPAVGISPIALAAYGYAQLTVAQKTPGCHLSWTTLAGIGKVESNHGTANGATLAPEGQALPPILGDPLDGQGNRQLIRDTDAGRLDGDRTYDRAVGPMQFLPSTWQQYQRDADADGVSDPNDINDAALAAADYLCAGGRDLATPGDWQKAILSYNALQVYVQAVFDAADAYGRQSRTAA